MCSRSLDLDVTPLMLKRSDYFHACALPALSLSVRRRMIKRLLQCQTCFTSLALLYISTALEHSTPGRISFRAWLSFRQLRHHFRDLLLTGDPSQSFASLPETRFSVKLVLSLCIASHKDRASVTGTTSKRALSLAVARKAMSSRRRPVP